MVMIRKYDSDVNIGTEYSEVDSHIGLRDSCFHGKKQFVKI